MESAVLGAAKQVEKALDDELDRLNNLQDDDLESIRRQRMQEMRQEAEKKAMWKRRGHGQLARLPEKEFFTNAKETDRFVAMISRSGSSRYSADVEEHMARIAERHLETFFGVFNAEKSPFLCDKFKLRVMPSIVLVKNHEVDRVLHGLDALLDDGKITTSGIEARLHSMGMVTHTDIGDDE